MPDNETTPSEYQKINTFTTASARRLSEESLTFPEMYPHEVAAYFGSDITNGLTVKQVRKLRGKYGENTVAGAVPVSFASSLTRQLKNLVPVFLLFASLLFHIFRGGSEFIAMASGTAGLILLNAVLEYRAGRVFTAVSRLSSPRTAVIRDGKLSVTDSRGLVPGDIIVLESDNIVPADARLIECSSLTVLETPVSGKKSASPKDARFLAPSKDVKVYENMVYAGTIVTGGNATAVVCATGKNVTLRREVKKEEAANLPAYLKTVLKTGRIIAAAAVAAEILLLIAGIISGTDLADTFIVALAVGAAAQSDTVFALSAAAMGKGIGDAMKSGGLFKNFDSFDRVAELDTVMCGKATAFPPKAVTLESFYDCSEIREYSRQNKTKAQDIIKYMLLCSSVKEKFRDQKPKKKKAKSKLKDDTVYEGSEYTLALLKAASEAGYSLDEAKKDFYRIETEYDSYGEMCRVLGLMDGKPCVILRGSPENVLSRCAGYRKDGKNYRIDEKAGERILTAAFDMAKTMIPIAVAMGYTSADSLRDITAEKKLIFLGFAGFYTSLEIETASAVFKCGRAGIQTVVFTDDSYYTALNMAKNAGVISGEDEICTPRILRETEEGLFIANNEKYNLFTGLSDEELLYILRLRKQNRHKVGVSASKIEQLTLVREADASFASSKGTNDALLHTCDVQLADGGFNTVVEAIKQSKLITKRIADVCQFMTCGFFTLLFWMLFSLVLYGEVPFRVRDVLIFGMFINTVFGFSLAFTPAYTHENNKILADKNHEVNFLAMTRGLLISLAYSVFGAALCVAAGRIAAGVNSNVGGLISVSVSLIAYSALMFLFSLMTGKSRSVFTNKFYRNYNSVTAFIIGFGVTAALTCLPAFSGIPAPGRVFGYAAVPLTDAVMAVSMAFIYFLLIQLALLTFEIKAKTKNKEKLSWRSQKTL